MAANKTHISVDVAIIGGGHAGCTMAAILGANGLSVACIDQDAPFKTIAPAFDGRTTAISYGSQRVIDAAGVWNSVKDGACPIKDIKIAQSGSPVLLEFLTKDTTSEAFGWIVENRHLRKALYDRLSKFKNVFHLAPARVTDFVRDENTVSVILEDGREIRAALIIGADGRNSFTRDWMGIATRGWDYNQRALVCIVQHENPHDNIAIEDFRNEGPLAILPMADDEDGGHRSALVWTEHGQNKNSALHWDDKTFLAALRERFPEFYGEIQSVGKRAAYPLGLIHAQTYIADRMVLVGDAAHGIHPIAGQGLNLGLRDVAVLSDLIINAKKKGDDIGASTLLQSYEAVRRPDNIAMAAATDALNKIFSNNSSSLGMLRKAGIGLIRRIEPVKKILIKQAMGMGGQIPALDHLKK